MRVCFWTRVDHTDARIRSLYLPMPGTIIEKGQTVDALTTANSSGRLGSRCRHPNVLHPIVHYRTLHERWPQKKFVLSNGPRAGYSRRADAVGAGGILPIQSARSFRHRRRIHTQAQNRCCHPAWVHPDVRPATRSIQSSAANPSIVCRRAVQTQAAVDRNHAINVQARQHSLRPSEVSA